MSDKRGVRDSRWLPWVPTAWGGGPSAAGGRVAATRPIRPGVTPVSAPTAEHPPVSRAVVGAAPRGPGSVWRTAQSPELLMNTVACQVTLFTDDSVDCS